MIITTCTCIYNFIILKCEYKEKKKYNLSKRGVDVKLMPKICQNVKWLWSKSKQMFMLKISGVACTKCTQDREKVVSCILNASAVECPSVPLIDPRSTVYDLGWHAINTVSQQSTNFHLIFMGRLTLGQLSTDCESSVDQVSTEIDRDVNWVPIMMLLLRALNEGINQQWIMDAITHHPDRKFAHNEKKESGLILPISDHAPSHRTLFPEFTQNTKAFI